MRKAWLGAALAGLAAAACTSGRLPAAELGVEPQTARQTAQLGAAGADPGGAVPAARQVAEAAPHPALSSKAAACVAAMRPGNWDSCGTSKIPLLSNRRVAEIANKLTNGRNGSGPRGIIEAWNGGLLSGDDLCFWGGGHNNYAGNDWYCLNLPNLSWDRSADRGIGPTPADKGLDGNTNPLMYPSTLHAGSRLPAGFTVDAREAGPAPTHTYGGIEATPDGRRCVIGGKITTIAGDRAHGDRRFNRQENLWCFDPGAATWTFHGGVPSGQWQAGTRLTLDPVSGRMIAQGWKTGGTFDPNDIRADSDGLLIWDRSFYYQPALETGVSEVAVFPDGSRMLVTMQHGRFRYWDIDDNSDGSISVGEIGSSRHGLNKESGMAWHPRTQKMVIWSGWDRVDLLDPVRRELTRLPPSATPGPRGPMNGVQTKWRYYEPLDVFVGYANLEGPAWFYRLPGSPPIAARPAAAESAAAAAAPAPEPPPEPLPEAVPQAAAPAALPEGDFTCADGSATPCEDLQRLVDETEAGGTLVLPRGKYASCAFVRRPMTIDLNGSALTGGVCGGKATIVQAADLTLMNGSCRAPGDHSHNLACVRREAPNLTLRRVYFHDGDQGLLGGVEGGRVLIEDSRFERLGGAGGKSHLIYVGKAEELIIRRSQFLCSFIGHAIKTGAKRTALIDSLVDQEDCTGSRIIDAFAGGELVVRNSTLIKGPKAENQQIIGYVPSGSGYGRYRPDFPAERVEVTGSTIDCGPRARVVVLGNGIDPQIVWSGNRLSGNCSDVPR